MARRARSDTDSPRVPDTHAPMLDPEIGTETAPVVRPASSTKMYFTIIVAVVVVLFAIYIVKSFARKQVSTPAASAPVASREVARALPLTIQPKAEWPRLVVPAAGERSQPIPVPRGRHVYIDGFSGIRYHCVYKDRGEFAFNDGEAPCPKHMQFVYLTNPQGTKEVLIPYAYTRLE